MRIVNEAGFIFYWPEGSIFVEVYRKDVAFAEQPFEVVYMGGAPRNDATLKQLAFSTSEYARF